jgi:methyl-accepting chemotaxis protein
MGNRHKRKLRNYFIAKNFQSRVIFTNLIYVLIILLITVGVLLGPTILDMLAGSNPETQHEATISFFEAARPLIPAAIVLVVLTVIHMIIITHRICGPLVNFAHTFQKVSTGDLTRRVVLRKGDYLKAEGDKINIMIDGLSNLILGLRRNHGDLVSVLKHLKRQVGNSEIRKNVEDALEILENEEKLVSEEWALFHLEDYPTASPLPVSSKSERLDKKLD